MAEKEMVRARCKACGWKTDTTVPVEVARLMKFEPGGIMDRAAEHAWHNRNHLVKVYIGDDDRPCYGFARPENKQRRSTPWMSMN